MHGYVSDILILTVWKLFTGRLITGDPFSRDDCSPDDFSPEESPGQCPPADVYSVENSTVNNEHLDTIINMSFISP